MRVTKSAAVQVQLEPTRLTVSTWTSSSSRIDKPLDESDWAAGYRADLWFGPDANALGTSSTGINSSDFAIRQAYVALRAPIGTGLDFKMGVFDSIIGYESIEAGNDPNLHPVVRQ